MRPIQQFAFLCLFLAFIAALGYSHEQIQRADRAEALTEEVATMFPENYKSALRSYPIVDGTKRLERVIELSRDEIENYNRVMSTDHKTEFRLIRPWLEGKPTTEKQK